MFDFENLGLKVLRFFFFKVFLDQCEKVDREERQLESYEIIYIFVVGRLLIIVCEVCIEFFSLQLFLFLFKDSVLKMQLSFLIDSR